MEPLLQVRNLTVDYYTRDRKIHRALDGISFKLEGSETLGVLGPSGSGKTTLASALLGLFSRTAQVSGSIRIGGDEVVGVSERRLRAIRGVEASIIFQEPALSLNPVMRVGDQVAEVIRAHRDRGRRECREQAEAALEEVCLRDSRIYLAYPHQLSAGQRQRVAIAQALVGRPRLLIADEPTSALDNTTQTEIFEFLKELKRRLGIALLLITHNPALLMGIADRVLILYAGRVVEESKPVALFTNPKHPYTKNLQRLISSRTADDRRPVSV